MAKKTTKKKFSFKNFFNPKPPSTVAGASKLVQGTVLSIKGNYKSPKTGLQQAKDDVLMDLGMKDKDVDYYARLDDRKKRSQQAMKEMQARILKGDDGPSKPRGETAAERAARLKRKALETRRAEGQEKRKKFYKEKGERLAKLKAKLLNLV